MAISPSTWKVLAPDILRHLKKKYIEIASSPVVANKCPFHHSISIQQLNLVLGFQETEEIGDAV